MLRKAVLIHLGTAFQHIGIVIESVDIGQKKVFHIFPLKCALLILIICILLSNLQCLKISIII